MVRVQYSRDMILLSPLPTYQGFSGSTSHISAPGIHSPTIISAFSDFHHKGHRIPSAPKNVAPSGDNQRGGRWSREALPDATNRLMNGGQEYRPLYFPPKEAETACFLSRALPSEYAH